MMISTCGRTSAMEVVPGNGVVTFTCFCYSFLLGLESFHIGQSGGGQDNAAGRNIIADHQTIAQWVMRCGTQYELLRLRLWITDIKNKIIADCFQTVACVKTYRCVRVASNLRSWVSVGYLRSTSSRSTLVLCG